MLTLSSLEPFALNNMLIVTVLGKIGKLINSFVCIGIISCDLRIMGKVIKTLLEGF